MKTSQRSCLKTGCLIGLTLALSACSARKSDPPVDDTDNSGSLGSSNDPTATPVLLDNNYSSVVGHVLSFFANEQFPGPALNRLGPPAFTQPQSTTSDAMTGVETAIFTCSNGGEATRVDNIRDPAVFQFTNCQYEDTLLNGQYGLAVGKYTSVREFDNFSADINGGIAIHEVTGAIVFKTGSPPCSTIVRTRSVEQYKITLADRTFELKDWNTTFEKATPTPNFCDADTLEISGQFSLRSDVTSNDWLEVAATETITGTSDNPTAGEITIRASDASKITLGFANGDNTTVSVTIRNSNGESTFDEPLTTWINSLLP
ncbi:MAG: hypothetical protein V3U65_14360 [Granulosicoccaceae bacterium]